MQILIETSARHVHLSSADMAVLFGAGAALTEKRPLSQPGQFLSEQRVNVVGPKGRFDNVAVLGPERGASQVEISLTDARALGVTVPVRESGILDGSAGITIEGPAGAVELAQGCIAAQRHIHLTPADADAAGLADKQVVSVAVSGSRALTFGEVIVRVRGDFAAAMHVDTDEANAAGLSGGAYGEIIG